MKMWFTSWDNSLLWHKVIFLTCCLSFKQCFDLYISRIEYLLGTSIFCLNCFLGLYSQKQRKSGIYLATLFVFTTLSFGSFWATMGVWKRVRLLCRKCFYLHLVLGTATTCFFIHPCCFLIFLSWICLGCELGWNICQYDYEVDKLNS